MYNIQCTVNTVYYTMYTVHYPTFGCTVAKTGDPPSSRRTGISGGQYMGQGSVLIAIPRPPLRICPGYALDIPGDTLDGA